MQKQTVASNYWSSQCHRKLDKLSPNGPPSTYIAYYCVYYLYESTIKHNVHVI